MKYRISWMARRLLVTAVLVTTCAGGAFASDAEALQDDFARFDRAYVPALALTKMGTREASLEAMKRLTVEWREFLANHGEAIPTDGHWQADLAQVGKAIASAETHLAEGQQLEAHEALEAVREILLETRRRNGIIYYLDYLTEFHTTMEEIVLPLTETTPGKLTSSEIAEVRRLTQKAIRQWEQVKSAPIQLNRFGFDEEKAAQRQQLLQAETRALEQLELALAGDDQARIIKTGTAIKPLFAKSFMLFGRFPAGMPKQKPAPE
jgi:hypothetical protein